MHVADPAACARIAPCPAEAVVEHLETVAGSHLPDRFRILAWTGLERRSAGDLPFHGLGIMRGDHPARQRDVGEVLAIGIDVWIERFRGAGEREIVSADGRRLVPGR